MSVEGGYLNNNISSMKQVTSKEIKALRKLVLSLWRGMPLCYSNMSPGCKVVFLMGRLHELEKETKPS